MRGKFEGVIHEGIPDNWDSFIHDNYWMKSPMLTILKQANDTEFKCITHQNYVCCEYKMKLNIFTFGKLKLSIPFKVIGLPISVSSCGFAGDLKSLINDYKKRKGLFIILNMDNVSEIPDKIGTGHTLPSCIFENKYISFEHYLTDLRSSYRRRILSALVKGKSLTIKRIECNEFTDELYALYIYVLKHSKYPLETLSIEFFRRLEGEIHVFYDDFIPIAFIMINKVENRLNFIFGGMDYKQRDEFDLYLNMLLTIVKLGIEKDAEIIDFGQTAEKSKCRIGCRISPKYMCVFSSYKIIDYFFRKFSTLLEYKKPVEEYRSLKK